MSKVKPPKSKGIPSKYLHARATFLYQAATYLTLQTATSSLEKTPNLAENQRKGHVPTEGLTDHSPLALRLGSDLQQLSRKAQIRLSIDFKRTICKACNTILVPGRTATQTIENLSRGGKKPWADVLVLECNICGGKKTFPVGANKQSRKSQRNVMPKVSKPMMGSDANSPSDLLLQTGTELDSNTG
ncbi:Rpr2-domain-containing protein [Setomelanomma holmii]|uniref:Rpr2-domain-containing protein n=1 Tax=Setomelanomma holmii TaxID=210430 RepID=A0A9P4LT06_9PLEO|nr:Rpr2-domain-containing protein [Setomelanomma holmii]